MNQFFDEESPYTGSARYGVTALGMVHASQDEITRLRGSLSSPGGARFQPSVLKPAESQTIAGLAAIVQAIQNSELADTPLTDWGVIASPKHMARVEGAESLYKYEIGGAWKVNPLVLPNVCLHAPSGTISQLLQIKGPNFGVGGGTNFITDGFLAACTLLDEQQLPGLWLVISQVDPDPVPDREGKNSVPTVVHALALGFQQVPTAWSGLRLSFRRSRPTLPAPWTLDDCCANFYTLIDFLKSGMNSGKYGAWTCDLDWGAQFLLTDDAPARSRRVPANACSAV